MNTTYVSLQNMPQDTLLLRWIVEPLALAGVLEYQFVLHGAVHDLRQELHDPVDGRLRAAVVRFQEHEVLDAINRDAVNGQIAEVGVKVVGKVGAIADHRICANLPQFVPGHVGFSVGMEEWSSFDLQLKALSNIFFDNRTLLLLDFFSRVTRYPLDASGGFNSFFNTFHCDSFPQ